VIVGEDHGRAPEILLDVRGLHVRFRTQGADVWAVNGADFSVARGETLGIVGESGSGKTISALSCLRLVASRGGEIVGGQIEFEGRDLLQLSDTDIRAVRGRRIALIPQDPMASLNPVLTIGRQIAEGLELHKSLGHRAARQRAMEMLTVVGIPDAPRCAASYPHQLSGGMRQRVMIAMALSCEPELLIADEPTTALDVTIQAQIIGLVQRLQAQFGMAVIWISHDLGIMARIADRIIVMYAGQVMEDAPKGLLFRSPSHPYTIGLLASVPRVDARRMRQLDTISGQPPDMSQLAAGCPFYDRCTFRIEKCRLERPPLFRVEPTHRAACWVEVDTGLPR
jgi:oligopeptide transport system ATP-binding protein